MAIQNFIPAVWAASLLEKLMNELVFGSPSVVNSNYQGDINGPGDTVHITQVSDVVVGDYTQNVMVSDGPNQRLAGINWQVLTDSQLNLVINQKKYFAVALDDIEAEMVAGDLMGHITQRGAYNLANVLDQYIASLFAPQSANIVPAVTLATSGQPTGYTLADYRGSQVDGALVQLKKVLDKANVPLDSRYVVVSPDIEAELLNNRNFVNADKAADDGDALKNGLIGRARGFDIHMSNNAPTTGAGESTMVAGHPMALTFAQKTSKLAQTELENGFSVGVKGLHVYGAKLIRPEAIASVAVTL